MPKKSLKRRPILREPGREYDPFDRRSPSEMHFDMLSEMREGFRHMTRAQKISFLEKLAVFQRLYGKKIVKK